MKKPVPDYLPFDNTDLRRLILPLIIEQTLAMLMGVIDTMQVSYVGEAAVSGVALVDMLNVLFINIFSALATGGAVVASQYIGAGRAHEAKNASLGLQCILFVSSLVLMGVILGFDTQLMHLLFGTVETDVWNASLTYLHVTAISFPFIALYNGAAAVFRSMGNSKISMVSSLIVNVLNLGGNSIMIYLLRWGVFGAALSTVIARFVAMAWLLWRLGDGKLPLHIPYKRFFTGKEKPKFSIMRRILAVGLPGSLENGTFQLGRVLVVSIISTFGTAQIAANSVANNLDSFGVLSGMAFNLAIITVVGQCCGAGRFDSAEYYIRKLMRWSWIIMAGVNVVLFALLLPLMHLYNISPEAKALAILLVILHNGTGIFLWTPAFVLPNAMKAAGDARFVMITAITSMMCCRVAMAYVLGIRFGMGAVGVWIAMILDWICRIIAFAVRYRSGKWQKSVI